MPAAIDSIICGLLRLALTRKNLPQREDVAADEDLSRWSLSQVEDVSMGGQSIVGRSKFYNIQSQNAKSAGLDE